MPGAGESDELRPATFDAGCDLAGLFDGTGGVGLTVQEEHGTPHLRRIVAGVLMAQVRQQTLDDEGDQGEEVDRFAPFGQTIGDAGMPVAVDTVEDEGRHARRQFLHQ